MKQVCEDARIAPSATSTTLVRPDAGYRLNVVAADVECGGDRGQCTSVALAIHGPGTDPDDQRTGMLATDRRARRARPDPDSDPHVPSVPHTADTRRDQRQSDCPPVVTALSM